MRPRGSGHLTNLGIPEWIATSRVAYAQIARDLATDLPALAVLRSKLRSKLQQSPLMDGPAFARAIENKYRYIWTTWCAIPTGN